MWTNFFSYLRVKSTQCISFPSRSLFPLCQQRSVINIDKETPYIQGKFPQWEASLGLCKWQPFLPSIHPLKTQQLIRNKRELPPKTCGSKVLHWKCPVRHLKDKSSLAISIWTWWFSSSLLGGYRPAIAVPQVKSDRFCCAFLFRRMLCRAGTWFNWPWPNAANKTRLTYWTRRQLVSLFGAFFGSAKPVDPSKPTDCSHSGGLQHKAYSQ